MARLVAAQAVARDRLTEAVNHASFKPFAARHHCRTFHASSNSHWPINRTSCYVDFFTSRRRP